MPVFNGERYLSQAIESVLGQTLEDLELVAVDDGSQDGSRAIVEGIARSDSRVMLVANEENLGISAALNHGLSVARASYVARLDADDIALPERLAHQAEFLDNRPTCAVVGGQAVLIDSEGQRGATTQFPTSNRAIRSTLLRHNCLAHPSVMMRRTAVESVGRYRFDYVEDYDLWLRLSDRFELANLPETVILYRLHPSQLSLAVVEERERRRLAVRDAARARRASRDDPLAETRELTPEILGGMNISKAEVAAAVEYECLAWAAMLAELGHREEAEQLVAEASRRRGRRLVTAFAAARELQEAATLLGAGRPVAGVLHVALAFGREPRYAFSRLTAWVGDRLSGRCSM